MARFACVFIAAMSGLKFIEGVAIDKDTYVPIKYPGPIQEVTFNRHGTPDDVPDECKGQNFCAIKPPDYPQELFNKMFKGQNLPPQPNLVIENVADRQGDPDSVDNCDSIVSYEPLYKVRSQRGDWRVVVQAPEENYVQRVRLETCRQKDAPCFTALPSSTDISTFCKQKYSVWEFLVKSDSGTERVKVDLPVCCSCHYKYVSKK